MENFTNRCPGCKRKSCDGCGIFQKLNTNKHTRINFPEGFKPDVQSGLGISFDVGTTTLAGMLWDLQEGSLLGVETASNPQAVFGADVVSRIQHAVSDEAALAEMQRLLVAKLDEMAERLWRGQKGAESTETASGGVKISRVTLAGNTAMCELLLGIKPEGLAGAPFTPDYYGIVCKAGKELGFRFLQEAQMIILPSIGGYVGADALMVYSYVNLQSAEKSILSVDIGTNGEILLQHKGRKYACSAAAGPALEGGAVSCGMRAAEGAVDLVSLSGRFPMQDIAVHVIGGGAPRGLCGSGLVDTLALLYRTGVLDQDGSMRSREEAKKAGAPERIVRRIMERDGGYSFLLTDEVHPVYLAGWDVRQMQLSVSAIRSGMEVLLAKADCRVEELDGIYLAGAFGCYIGTESGITVGLFPDIAREKMIQAGNLAGTGAAMALLSEKTCLWMEQECREIIHVELAEEPDFQKLFLEHLNFPL